MRLKSVGVQVGTGSLFCCITVLSIALRDSASPQGTWTWGNTELLAFAFFSRDYHKKQNALRALQKKALDKNPDEFYFKMINTRLKVRNYLQVGLHCGSKGQVMFFNLQISKQNTDLPWCHGSLSTVFHLFLGWSSCN